MPQVNHHGLENHQESCFIYHRLGCCSVNSKVPVFVGNNEHALKLLCIPLLQYVKL